MYLKLLRSTCAFLLFTSLVLLPTFSLRAEPIPPSIEASLNILQHVSVKASCEPTTFAGEPFFTVETNIRNKTRDYTFDAAGVPVNIQVFREELPPPVEAVLQAELTKGASLSSLSRSYENGTPVFELELRLADTERLLILRPDGSITGREISISDLPGRVLNSLKKAAGKDQPDKILRSTENDTTYFSIALLHETSPNWITFDEEGNLVEQEERTLWAALPEAVQASIQNKTSTRERLRIIRKTSEKNILFEVWALLGEEVALFWVAPNGAVFSSHP